MGLVLPANANFPPSDHEYLHSLFEDVPEVFRAGQNAIKLFQENASPVSTAFRTVQFRYGMLDFDLNAYATRRNGTPTIYISHGLIRGISGYALALLSDSRFTTPLGELCKVTLESNENPKALITRILQPDSKVENPFGLHALAQFEHPIGFLFHRYLVSASIWFVLLHELAHLYLGHVDYMQSNKLSDRLFSNGSTTLSRGFEFEADAWAAMHLLVYGINVGKELRPYFSKNSRTSHFSSDFQLHNFLSVEVSGVISVLLPYFLSAISPVTKINLSHPPGLYRAQANAIALLKCPDIAKVYGATRMNGSINRWIELDEYLRSSLFFGESALLTNDFAQVRNEHIARTLRTVTDLGIQPGMDNLRPK
jgi:hypothetical protein